MLDESVIFLSVDQVIILHDEAIKRYSPDESYVIRDRGLLESAVMAPQQTFGGEFLYDSITAMAAAYFIGISLNHAFENGNKRAALASCSTFLRMNGYRLILTQDEAVDIILGIITHKLDRADVHY